jgi:ribosomal protein L11 methyltransferase
MVLVIEPGRAFGTGHHGSTAGCLGLLERAADEASPPHAIDLGTGSGILAIAAARLGVRRILAVDDDPDAVRAAVANAELNGVADRVDCRLADAGTLEAPPAPLVLANLLAAAHLKLAVRYARLLAPGGTLVLGGILDAEAGAVGEAMRACGCASAGALSLDGWTSLAFRAPIHALA